MTPLDPRAPFRPPHPPNADLARYARWERVPVPRAHPAARSARVVPRLRALLASWRADRAPTDERFLLDTLAERRARP